jgi:hypothetical protein
LVCEVEFLQKDELFQFNRTLIDQVAFPVGDRYPEEIMTNYLAWYGGMVKKYRPTRFLEIGVRYGYTGIVCCLAAADSEPTYRLEYLGVDDESYHARSCDRANENLRTLTFGEHAKVLKWNSFNGLPPGCGTFDMIHIDGNHDTHGVLNDLGHCWPVLKVGGFILLDDYYFPEIKLAVDQWLTLYSGETDEGEVIPVQFVTNERGHCYIRKIGLTRRELADSAFDLTAPVLK